MCVRVSACVCACVCASMRVCVLEYVMCESKTCVYIVRNCVIRHVGALFICLLVSLS